VAIACPTASWSPPGSTAPRSTIVRRMFVHGMPERRCGTRRPRSVGRWMTTPSSPRSRRRAEQDHVDRVAVRARHTPQAGSRPVRRERRRADGEHAGGDPLLRRVGRARQATDERVDLVDGARSDRPIPRRPRQARPLERDDAVVGACPVVEVGESHTAHSGRRPGRSGNVRPPMQFSPECVPDSGSHSALNRTGGRTGGLAASVVVGRAVQVGLAVVARLGERTPPARHARPGAPAGGPPTPARRSR
jgi:hypothetical protein